MKFDDVFPTVTRLLQARLPEELRKNETSHIGVSTVSHVHDAVRAAALDSEIEEIQILLERERLQGFDGIAAELDGPVAPTAANRAAANPGDAEEPAPAGMALQNERRRQEQPTIESVRSRATPNLPIIDDPFVVTGHQLVIDGRFPSADDVRVWLGFVETSPAPRDITNTRIAVTVPSDVRAGVHDVVVALSYAPRSRDARPRIATSNLATFVLQPLLIPSSIAFEDGCITLAVEPMIGGDQHVSVLLNEWEPSTPGSRRPQAYVLQIPPYAIASNAYESERHQMSIPIPEVLPGTYLVRLQVDGAKSPLSIADGRFAFPRITVP